MLTMRNAPPGCVVLAITNHPRYPGQEVEQIFRLVRTAIEEGSWLDGSVDVSHVGAYPGKQVIGDIRETSHEVLSSATQISWAGGGQIDESAESEDLDRYAKIATLETRFPRHLMLLSLTVPVAGPNETGPRVLGDFFYAAEWHAMVAFGTKLCELTGDFPTVAVPAGTLTVAELDDLDDAAVAPGVVFRIAGEPNLYIPQGSAGYQTFDGTNLDAQVTTIAPISFVVHSNKIWALDGDGGLFKSVDGTTWLPVLALDPGITPRSLVAFLDRSDIPAIHIATDIGVFALDESVPAIYLTQCKYSPSTVSGVACEEWRTDLYTAIGQGIQRYTLGTVNAGGIDRDDGTGLHAYFSTLKAGFNDLFGGLSPLLQEGGEIEEVFVDYGMEVYLGAVQDRAAVMRLTGGQAWHTVWVAETSGGTVNDLHVSRLGGDSLLMWGHGGTLYVHRLTVDFDNPKDNPESLYMPAGELVSAWLDMNIPADRKTMAAIETRAHSDLLVGSEYDIDYQIDDDDVTETWTPLATIDSPGFHELRLGEHGQFPTTQTTQTRFDGQGFSRFRYRIRMRRDEDHLDQTPAMETITQIYRPRMRRVRNFSFVVDCTNPEHDAGYALGADERRKVLQELIESEVFFPFLYKNEWVMVQIPYVQGAEGTGLNAEGNVNVSALESWEQELAGAS